VSYLVDTNVLSELRRKRPERAVVEWIGQRPRQSLHLSVLTLGEIRKGIEAVKDKSRRQALLDWLEVDLPNYFLGRLLPVDQAVADRWGRLTAAAGRPVPVIDGLLAATAAQHDLVLVTRNVRDFAGLGVTVIDPWVG